MAPQNSWCIDHLGRHSNPMVNEFFIPVAVGTMLGFLSGLGVGGGSLLIIWLTMIVQSDPQEARLINLMFFIPSALICCRFRRKQGNLNLRKILPAIIAGCVSAAAGAWLSLRIDTHILKKLFGMMLLFAGIREVYCRPRKFK